MEGESGPLSPPNLTSTHEQLQNIPSQIIFHYSHCIFDI